MSISHPAKNIRTAARTANFALQSKEKCHA